MSDRVTFGEVQFDPVSVTDFRLSVEGTSNVGKSNTLAVLLEDLSGVRLPTLIVERLGALSPVRFEDGGLIVVGARDEEGIDLAVALEDLDHVGEWVLDHGRKVLLDISTYADYEDERSRTHLAAARALRSLNDRAHEKYRAGDRTKSLLVVDEAHILAPKDSAPEPELDDWVKRCRGQLIKASTEGGNKGISIVTAYQRRAFLHNGVIQLCEDYVAHKPGAEDIDRTAKALQCDPSQLAELGTGEILARGTTITDGSLAGPTTVRKRRSPDPREETFELPDVSGDTREFLEEIAAEVEAERERREERQDELTRLREENQKLRERIDELEQELADTDRLASALENLGQANGGSAARDVGEGVEGLQERIDELRAERERFEQAFRDVEKENDELVDEITEREERIADLEATVQELQTAFDGAADLVEGLADVFGVETSIPRPDTNDETVEELRSENKRLRDQLVRVDGTEKEPLEDVEEFLHSGLVREAINEAKEESSETYVQAVIETCVDTENGATYDDIAETLGHSGTSNVSRGVTALESRKIVTSEKGPNGKKVVHLNLDGMQEIRAAAQRRRRRRDLMNEL